MREIDSTTKKICFDGVDENFVIFPRRRGEVLDIGEHRIMFSHLCRLYVEGKGVVIEAITTAVFEKNSLILTNNEKQYSIVEDFSSYHQATFKNVIAFLVEEGLEVHVSKDLIRTQYEL